jgi:GTP-binding protein Era
MGQLPALARPAQSGARQVQESRLNYNSAMTEQRPEHVPTSSFRSGFVAIIGRPNVGKSTLLNALLGQKVAAVSPRPQTTRRRQLGILTLPEAQIVFTDTPGIHKPQHRLGEQMNRLALDALKGVDVILWLVDGTVMPAAEDELVAKHLKEIKRPPKILLVLNKIDRLERTIVEERKGSYNDLLPQADVIAISALTRQGLDELQKSVVAVLPIHPPFYEEETLTDLYERDIAADLIREASLIELREEVPHSLAVRMEEFKERSTSLVYILATLIVEKESHKAIVIGRGGEMLKKIGSRARREIEKMCARKVFLELRVKVMKNWRNSDTALRMLGYTVGRE